MRKIYSERFSIATEFLRDLTPVRALTGRSAVLGAVLFINLNNALAANKNLPCQPQSQINTSSINAKVILVGEMHGTMESPAFVSGLACSLLKEKKALVLAIEMPSDRQEVINRYLDSNGENDEKERLIKSDFGGLSDGRSSKAMLELVEQFRSLRRAGAVLSIVPIDKSYVDGDVAPVKDEKTESNSKDFTLANNIERLVSAYPDRLILALTGANHARRIKGAPWDADYEPMGYHLAQHMPIYSISFSHPGGSAWICKRPPGSTSNTDPLICGVNAVRGQKLGSENDFNALILLDRITASPPMGQ